MPGTKVGVRYDVSGHVSGFRLQAKEGIRALSLAENGGKERAYLAEKATLLLGHSRDVYDLHRWRREAQLGRLRRRRNDGEGRRRSELQLRNLYQRRRLGVGGTEDKGRVHLDMDFASPNCRSRSGGCGTG